MTTGPAHWEALARSRALDNQVYVATVSPARDEAASYVAWGHRFVVVVAAVVVVVVVDDNVDDSLVAVVSDVASGQQLTSGFEHVNPIR